LILVDLTISSLPYSILRTFPSDGLLVDFFSIEYPIIDLLKMWRSTLLEDFDVRRELELLLGFGMNRMNTRHILLFPSPTHLSTMNKFEPNKFL